MATAATAGAAAAPITYHILGAGAMGCLLAGLLAHSSGASNRHTLRRPIRVALLTRPTAAGRGQPQPQPQQGVIRVVDAHSHSYSQSAAQAQGPTAGGDATAAAPPAFFEAAVAVEENDPGWAGGAGLPPIERLMVLTKAYDAIPALRALAPRLSPEAVVVLLPNGMGHYEEIRAEPRLQHVTRWLLGTTTHGALLLPPPPPAPTDSATSATSRYYHVSHTGRGETYLGLPPLASVARPLESLAALQTLLHELPPESHAALGLVPPASTTPTTTAPTTPAQPPPSESPSQGPSHIQSPAGAGAAEGEAQASADGMQRRLWMKLAVNSCINPLTALVRRRNGAVGGDPSLRPLVTALCTEAAAVANAACFPHTSPSIPPPLPSPNEGDGNGPAAPVAHPQTRGQGPALSLSFDPAEMEAYVLQVAAQTAGNESSMLRDVVQGRKTEIDYINGYIVREAQRLNDQQQQQPTQGAEGGKQPQPLLSAPTHEMLLRLIKAAERGEGGV